MSAPMVRAILDGRKTQTRRIVAPANSEVLGSNVTAKSEAWIGLDFTKAKALNFSIWGPDMHLAVPWKHSSEADYSDGVVYRVRPRTELGEHLWVKETFQTGEFAQNEPRGFVYRATDPDWESTEGWKWKPSIFMPRIASRITLEIIGLRVERLNEISADDAIAEGVEIITSIDHGSTDPIAAYRVLWESINGKGSWEKNPYVWCISFKRHV